MHSLLTKVQNLTYERDTLLQEKRNVAMTGFQILIITFCIIIACEFNNRWRQGSQLSQLIALKIVVLDAYTNVMEHTSKTDPTVNIVQLRIKHEIEKQVCIWYKTATKIISTQGFDNKTRKGVRTKQCGL